MSYITPKSISLSELGSTAHTHTTSEITNYFDTYLTGGTYYGGEITFSGHGTNFSVNVFDLPFPPGFSTLHAPIDNSDGSLTLSTETAYLLDNYDYSGATKMYILTGGTTGIDFPAIPNNQTSYIVGEYNNGNPQFNVITDVELIEESSIIPYYTLYRTDNAIQWLSWDQTAEQLAMKLHHRIVKTRRFEREDGLILSEVPTRIVTVTYGRAWNGVNRTTLASFTSSANTLTEWYHVGGVWTGETVTQYTNQYYDDGTDRQTLLPHKWVVLWMYRCKAENLNRVSYVMSDEYTNQASALLDTVPTDLPDIVLKNGLLIGRIIIETGSSSGTIQSAFSVSFAASNVIDHNDTGNIDGGSGAYYYHLGQSDYYDIINGSYVRHTLFDSHTGDTNNPHQTTFNNLVNTAHTHSISDVIGIDDRYVNVTGDTMTGNLIVNGTITASNYENTFTGSTFYYDSNDLLLSAFTYNSNGLTKTTILNYSSGETINTIVTTYNSTIKTIELFYDLNGNLTGLTKTIL